MRWHQRFFWLLLVLLPTQLGLHFWPAWAGVLGRRVDYLAPTIYLTDIIIFATLTFWFFDTRKSIKELVFSILGKQIHPKVNVFSYILYTKPYILAVVFVALNIFFATSRPVALYKWIKVCEFVLLGWYIVKTRPTFVSIVTPLSIGIFYSSVLAIAQFFLQHSVGDPLWWFGERTFDVGTPGIARASMCQWVSATWTGCPELLRPYATFPHPNVLGGFLAAVLPLVLVSAGQRVSGSMNKYFYITFYIGIIALLITFSRSAIGVGFIGIGVSIWYLVYRKKKHSMFSNILYTIPFILFIVALAWSFSPTEESVVVRGQLNVAAIKLWQSAPLFGVGLGNFLVRLPEALPTRTIYFLQPVHNIYLLLLSEVGVVGIGIIVLLIVYYSKQELGIRNYGKRNRVEIFVIRNSLFVILLLGLVDHYPLTLQQGQLLLTVMIGMSILKVREVREVPHLAKAMRDRRKVREVKK